MLSCAQVKNNKQRDTDNADKHRKARKDNEGEDSIVSADMLGDEDDQDVIF